MNHDAIQMLLNDFFGSFLACLSLNDCGSHMWAEDLGDAAWHHESVVA